MEKKKTQSDWYQRNREKKLEYSKKYYREHYEQRKHIHAKYRQEHKREKKDGYLKRTYGISLEKYDELLSQQNGVCAICLSIQKNEDRLAVDHDHETGKVRALLCHGCNFGIGVFKDNPLLLEKARDYLIKWSK